MDRQQVREQLRGPINSIRVPFQQDGSIDFDGLRNVIEFGIQAGSKTVLLTAGDSHYFCLSDAEIAEVTKIAVQQARGRAMVVAADRLHATNRAVEFARFAREAGADVLMCLPPDWGGSATPQSLSDHYAAVAKIMPVMIVTGVFLSRGVSFGLETIRLALAENPNIVAIKDDMCGEFAPRLCLLAHSHCAVFAGGQKANHMNMHPYGCDGYLSTFISFRPEIAWRYWAAIETGDLASATRVIRDYDTPLFDFLITLPGGFDAGLHGIQELSGVAQRWRRAPYHSLTDAEMERLQGFLLERKILS